ncbi:MULTISPECIES: amidohydrolase [Burkholderia]|uniref:amidohydrolase n=1 Tax=Burkholderia TaxID=32008 RepID=UPI001F609D59|nr:MULTISPECIES: amidohydrolase [Burkholderia]MCI3974933.1 amidohydrolase [Burkholderia sp. HI4860]MDN7793177.1 amidohydrolase [Burkholderia contaminans]
MLSATEPARAADLVVFNGKIATQDEQRSFVSALAVKDGRIVATGDDRDVLRHAHGDTACLDLNGRTVIPGLVDAHLQAIRGGTHFNLELRWDGVPSLAAALELLHRQAVRTPAPHWVRVGGGWTALQFAEKRGPTVAELNAIAPDTPVFVQHLGDSAWLNAAALRAIGYGRDTPDPPGGELRRDRHGRPTGLLLARSDPAVLAAALARAPVLGAADRINSTRQFMRALNRVGVTSAIDAGGDGLTYPDDYAAVIALARRGELTTRIAYALGARHAGREIDDFAQWIALTSPGDGDAFLRANGAGARLLFSAVDLGNFLDPRTELPASVDAELTAVVRLLVRHRWPFRLQATYDESIGRFLDVFEAVNRDTPFAGLRWCFDRCETMSDANIARVAALGGGVTVQPRMAFQGEAFIARDGAAAATRAPPIRAMLAAGLPVGAGSGALDAGSYNPFVALYWMVSGRSVGGTVLYPARNRLGRMEALRRYTVGSAWFSADEHRKGALVPGRYADFAVLSDDYFTIDTARIPQLSSVLTVVDGKVVHAEREFASLAPPPPPVSPGWSPVADGDGTPAAGANGHGSPRASAAGDACMNPGTDACRARGPGRRFARPRYPAASAAGNRCEACGRCCVAC